MKILPGKTVFQIPRIQSPGRRKTAQILSTATAQIQQADETFGKKEENS